MNNPATYNANIISGQVEKLREDHKVIRDIVRFMRDDVTARDNRSALLMYLEKRVNDLLPAIDLIDRQAATIAERDPNAPEELPF